MFWVAKRGNKRNTNRSMFQRLQTGARGIRNRGSFRDFKSGQKDDKSGQRDFSSEQRLQIEAKGISKRGRDYKSVQNKNSVNTKNQFVFISLCVLVILCISYQLEIKITTTPATTFRGMSSNIPGNVAKHSGECPQTIKKILENILGHVV